MNFIKRLLMRLVDVDDEDDDREMRAAVASTSLDVGERRRKMAAPKLKRRARDESKCDVGRLAGRLVLSRLFGVSMDVESKQRRRASTELDTRRRCEGRLSDDGHQWADERAADGRAS